MSIQRHAGAPAETAADNRMVDRKEAARQLGTSTWIVDQLRRSGELPSTPIGRNGKCVRILQSDLDEFKRRRR